MLFECIGYTKYKYELLNKNKEDWINLICEKERLERLNKFVTFLLKEDQGWKCLTMKGPPPRG